MTDHGKNGRERKGGDHGRHGGHGREGTTESTESTERRKTTESTEDAEERKAKGKNQKEGRYWGAGVRYAAPKKRGEEGFREKNEKGKQRKGR
ncbi:MAG: hypothetical protein D6679_04480 [Candidatus Hydrogenedentota bacterium]|nr:MAG: hypothetical protein D6679_04480 [Candidatus Hydrogenedentota bacterium]